MKPSPAWLLRSFECWRTSGSCPVVRCPRLIAPGGYDSAAWASICVSAVGCVSGGGRSVVGGALNLAAVGVMLPAA